jgi:hypothetical protein
MREWTWAVGICLVTALVVVGPFFVLGIASGHDFEFHAASWLDVAGQWKEGIVFPRWAEWANHGFGEPRFIFYPPLSWMLGAALGSVIPWNAVPVVFIVLVQTVAGICAFAFLRNVTALRGAVFGAACYAANPYALLVVYMRSDFAEQLGAAFFPLLILLALRVAGILGGGEEVRESGTGGDLAEIGRPDTVGVPIRKPGGDVAWFAVVFAGMWLANAPTGVMASYSAALVFGWAVLRQRTLWPGIRGACGLALGFGLTGFYLVPAAYEQRWVNIEQALASGLQPTQNFLYTAINDPEHTLFNWIASSVAVLLIVLTGVAALLARRKKGEAWSALVMLAGAGTVLMLRFTDILWRLLPKLRFVQFPWRWMCLVAVCYAFFLGLAFGRLRRGWILAIVVVICCVGTAVVLVQEGWWDTEDLPTLQAAIGQQTGFDGTDEYDPAGDDHYNIPATSPQVELLFDDAQKLKLPETRIAIRRWSAEDKELTVKSSEDVRVGLRLLNYPAWQVQVNGAAMQPARGEEIDRMVVPLKAGTSTILVHFSRTADRTIGAGISLVSLLIAVGLLLRGSGDGA